MSKHIFCLHWYLVLPTLDIITNSHSKNVTMHMENRRNIENRQILHWVKRHSHYEINALIQTRM